MYQALYRKWRSRTFSEVVGQAHVTETLKRQVETHQLSHAYLFTGTRGTGKTSCAKILSRAVNCEHPVGGDPCNVCAACTGIENGSILDVLELDAASNNGVDQVRTLRDEAFYTPVAVRKKVYIIDEVHMLSTPAFNALLKILEEPPSHLMFILATTELHKVPATIRSRCQQFAFKRILPGEISQHLSAVAKAEGIDLTPEGAGLLARLADGGMRDAMSLLDQCSGGQGRVDEEAVLSILGLAGNGETARLMSLLTEGDAAGAMEQLDRLYRSGKKIESLLGELAVLTRDLLLKKTAPAGGDALMTGGYDETTLRTLLEKVSAARLVSMLSLLRRTAVDLTRSGDPRIDAELCLLRMADETLDGDVTGLAARLTRLEEMLAGGGGVPGPVPEGAKKTPPPSKENVPTSMPPKEELPPWEEEPPPVAEKPKSTPPTKPSPPPKPQESAPAARGVGDGFWRELVAGLKGKVGFAEYPFLSDPALVTGVLEGETLTLWTDSELTRTLLDTQSVTAAVTAAASAKAGYAVATRFRVGSPPAVPESPPTLPKAEPEKDALDELLASSGQFENIIVTE